jgi:hypothetical protein
MRSYLLVVLFFLLVNADEAKLEKEKKEKQVAEVVASVVKVGLVTFEWYEWYRNITNKPAAKYNSKDTLASAASATKEIATDIALGHAIRSTFYGLNLGQIAAYSLIITTVILTSWAFYRIMLGRTK